MTTSKRRPTAALAVLVLAVVASTTTACSDSGPTDQARAYGQRVGDVSVTSKAPLDAAPLAATPWPAAADPALAGVAAAVHAGPAIDIRGPKGALGGSTAQLPLPAGVDARTAFVATRRDDSTDWTPVTSTTDDTTVTVRPRDVGQIALFWIDPAAAGVGAFGAVPAPTAPACTGAPSRASAQVSGAPGVTACLDTSGPTPRLVVVNSTALPVSGPLPAGATASLGPVDGLWSDISARTGQTTEKGRLLLAPGATATVTTADAATSVDMLLVPDPAAFILGGIWSATLRWFALFAPQQPRELFARLVGSDPASATVRDVTDCVGRNAAGVDATVATCIPVAAAAIGRLEPGADIPAGIDLLTFLDVLGLPTVAGSLLSTAGPTTGPRTVTYLPAPPLVSPTWDEIKDASIPAMCSHPPAKLVDGVDRSLPAYGSGGDYIGELELLRTLSNGQPGMVTDIPSEAGPLTAVVLSCNAGGVAWPNTIMFFSSGGVYYGNSDLFGDGSDTTAPWRAAGLNAPGREGVGSIRRVGDQVEVSTTAEQGTDAECCPSASATVQLRPDRGQIRITSITRDGGD